MKPIKTILCPTDFSPCAGGALQQALALAETHDARIELLHVANVPRYVRRDMVGFMGESGAKPLSDIALEECSRRMDVLEESLSQAERARLTTHCRFGDPIGTILHYADAHQADLVVLGSTGNARVSKVLLGGIAGKTVRRAKVPVLAVPCEARRPLRKVLVATDFSECATAALEAAALLAEREQAKLVLAYVTPSAWSLPTGLTVGASGQGSHWLELLEREAREQLEDFVGQARVRGTKIDEHALLIGSPAQSLLHYAEEHACDMIALGTHGRSAMARLMLGSVAETVVHHAKVPVLTVRSGVGEDRAENDSKE